MKSLDFQFSQLAILSQDNSNKQSSLQLIGLIFTNFSLAEIQEKVKSYSDGWNGTEGAGARIISKILFQV